MPKQNTNTRPKQKKKHIISANKPLSARQKKAIAAAIRKAQMQGRRAASAQQTIPYKEMYPDGICKVKDNYFTKTIQFFDINYQLARNEDKNEIFENYCDFLNYFDQSISVQFSFLNQTVDMKKPYIFPNRQTILMTYALSIWVCSKISCRAETTVL